MPPPIARSARIHVLLLVAILLFGMAVRVYLFQGYVGLDDGEYARLAFGFAHGSFVRAAYDGPVVFPLRVGVIGPTAALFRLFGLSEWTMVLYPFVLSLFGMLLTYFCARLFFGQRAGLLAATLMAIFPWDIESSTQLLPDLPSAFFAAAGITLILYLERSGVQRRWGLFGGGCLAGLALGMAWLCKESVSYLAPFCLILLVLSIRHDRERMWIVWTGFAAGAMSILLGEMLVYQRLTGDLLFRFHETERNYQQNAKYFFTEGSVFGWEAGTSYRQALVNRLLVQGPSVILLNRSYLYLPLVATIGLLYAFIRRDRSFLIPGLWFSSLALMFNFASSSTSSYVPLPLFNRYLYHLFYPSVVVAAGFLASALFSTARPGLASRTLLFRWIAVVASGAILWVGGIDLLRALKYPPRWLADVRAVRPVVTPRTTVYSDTLTLRALEFFQGYPKNTAWTDFDDLQSPNQIAAGSLVIVNRPSIGWLDKHGGIWGTRRRGYRRYDFYVTPPGSWVPVWRGLNLTAYRVVVAARMTLDNNSQQASIDPLSIREPIPAAR